MNGLDTNVLVAWILGSADRDDLPGGSPFRVSHVVVAELVWVFDRVYRQSRADVATIIGLLLQTDCIHLADEEVVRRALDDFRSGRADFADYLLMQDGRAAGCETTLTYDREAGRHPGFTLLKGDG